jgi:hypothetical protein
VVYCEDVFSGVKDVFSGVKELRNQYILYHGHGDITAKKHPKKLDKCKQWVLKLSWGAELEFDFQWFS